jgi:hypothetical protein
MSHTGSHLGSSNPMSLEPSLEMNIHVMSLIDLLKNRRNRFGFHNNDRQNYGRNGYNDRDRNAYNAPKRVRDIFNRGTDSQRKKYWR